MKKTNNFQKARVQPGNRAFLILPDFLLISAWQKRESSWQERDIILDFVLALVVLLTTLH